MPGSRENGGNLTWRVVGAAAASLLVTVVLMAMATFATATHDRIANVHNNMVQLESRVRKNEITNASVQEQLSMIKGMLVEIRQAIEGLRRIK